MWVRVDSMGKIVRFQIWWKFLPMSSYLRCVIAKLLIDNYITLRPWCVNSCSTQSQRTPRGKAKEQCKRIKPYIAFNSPRSFMYFLVMCFVFYFFWGGVRYSETFKIYFHLVKTFFFSNSWRQGSCPISKPVSILTDKGRRRSARLTPTDPCSPNLLWNVQKLICQHASIICSITVRVIRGGRRLQGGGGRWWRGEVTCCWTTAAALRWEVGAVIRPSCCSELSRTA